MDIESAYCYLLTVKGDVRGDVDQEVHRLCDTLAQKFPDHNVQKLDPLPPVVQVHMIWDGNSWVWPTCVRAMWMEMSVPDMGDVQREVLHIPTPVEGACIVYGNTPIDDKYVNLSEGLYILNKKTIFDFMNFVPGFFTSPFISQMVSVLIEKHKTALQTNECLNNELKTRQTMEKGYNSQIQSWKDKFENVKRKNEVAEIKEKTAEKKKMEVYRAEIENLKKKIEVCRAETKEKTAEKTAALNKKVEALLQKNAELAAWKSKNAVYAEQNYSETLKWKLQCEKLRKQLEQQKEDSKKCLGAKMDAINKEQKQFKKRIHEQMESAYLRKVKILEEKVKTKDETIRAHEKQMREDAKWVKKQNREIVQLTDKLKKRESDAVTADEILDYAKLRGLMVDMCQKAGISGCDLNDGSLNHMLLKVIGILDDVMAKINHYSEGNIDMHSLTIMVELFKARKKTKYTFKDMHELFAVQHYQFNKKMKHFMKITEKMKEQKHKIQKENHNLRSQLMKHILSVNDQTVKMDSHVLCKDIVVVTNAIMTSEVKHGLTFWSHMVGKYSIDTRLHIVAESIAIVATRVISATQIQRQYRRYYCTKMYHQVFSKKPMSSMSTAWGKKGGKRVEDTEYVHSYYNCEDPDGKFGVKYYCMSKQTWRRKLKVASSDKTCVRKYKNECIYALLRYFCPQNMDYITEQIKNLVEVILMKEIPVSGPPIRASALQKKIRGFYRDKDDMVEFSQSDDPENIRAQLAMLYQDQMSDATDEINVLIEQYPKTWPSRFLLGVPIPQGDTKKLKQFMFNVFEHQKEKDQYFVNNRVQKVPRDLISVWRLSQQSAIRLSVKWNTLHNCAISNMFHSNSLPPWFAAMYGTNHPINRTTSP